MVNEFKSILNLNKENLIKIILEYKAQEQDYKLQNQLFKELINNYAKHSMALTKANGALKMNSIMVDIAKDIIVYANSDGSIIEANKAAVENYGYSYAELLNMKLQQLRHPLTMKDFKNQIKVSTSEGIVFECIDVRKDGTSFPVEISSRTTDINGELFKVHIIRNITERKQAEEKIIYLANYDSLTDIPNRGFLMSQFNKTLEQSIIAKFKFAVMLFDVDKFKLINDTQGHDAGDEVLKKVAQRLQKVVRKADLIGRLGGDEFLVIQTFIKDKSDASILANRILNGVANPVKWNNVNLNVYISIGIAIYPEDSDNIEGLIHYADSAMYSIKKKGGNAYNFYIT